jgi:hypothetical protein
MTKHQSRRICMRTDVSTAGTSDIDATAIYDHWNDVRCRSIDELAAVQALMMRSSALGSLGGAYRELRDRVVPNRDRDWWAGRVGGLVQCLGEGAPSTEEEERQLVRRLWLAWEKAARATVPVWATPGARMPRLMLVSPELPRDRAFQKLSASAQVLIVSLLSDANGRAGDGCSAQCFVLRWDDISARAAGGGSAAQAAIRELAEGGWISTQEVPDVAKPEDADRIVIALRRP